MLENSLILFILIITITFHPVYYSYSLLDRYSNFTILYEKSGGLADLPGIIHKIDSKNLGEDEKEELINLINKLHISNYIDNNYKKNVGADYFEYFITIKNDNEDKEVFYVTDINITKEFQDLFQFLQDKKID